MPDELAPDLLADHRDGVDESTTDDGRNGLDTADDTHDETVAELGDLIEEWIASRPSPDAGEVQVDDATQDRLEDLGYL